MKIMRLCHGFVLKLQLIIITAGSFASIYERYQCPGSSSGKLHGSVALPSMYRQGVVKIGQCCSMAPMRDVAMQSPCSYSDCPDE